MSKYETPHYDKNHDKGELIEMKPEAVQILNDVIWEIVNRHPYVER